MINDIIKIEDNHRKNAGIISFFCHRGDVVAIGGESGSGKSETALALKEKLSGSGINAAILQLDDYFRLPPKTNAEARKADFSHVGPGEVNLELLDSHLAAFKAHEPHVDKPLVIFDANEIAEERLSFAGADVLIVEGTYSLMLENADFKVYIEDSKVESRRHARNRERQDAFLDKVLRREKDILAPFRQTADLLIVDGRLERTSIVSSVAMFSIHGYFDVDGSTIGRTDTGGQVVHVTEMAKQLATAGVRVDIYTRLFDDMPCEQPKSIPGFSNARLIRIPCGPAHFVRKEDIYPLLDEFVENCKSYIDSSGLRYDLMHGHYADGGYAAMKLAEYYGVPLYFTAHSLGAWKRDRLGDDPSMNYEQRISAETLAMERCTAQSAYNSMQVEQTLRLYPSVSASSIMVIPSGIDLNAFCRRDGRRNDLYADFLSLGRLDRTKGHAELIRAFGRYVREYEESLIDRPSLVICGGSDPLSKDEMSYMAELIGIAREEGVANRVSFAGNVRRQDVPDSMARSRVFILSSVSELMGMTAQEAMASGCIVLISKYAGAASIVKNMKHAFVFDPLDTEEFALLLSQVRNLGFGEFANRMKNDARKLMESEYSWESVGYRYLDMYRLGTLEVLPSLKKKRIVGTH